MLYPFHCWAAIIKYSGVDVACREEKMTSSAISNFVVVAFAIKETYMSNCNCKLWMNSFSILSYRKFKEKKYLKYRMP